MSVEQQIKKQNIFQFLVGIILMVVLKGSTKKQTATITVGEVIPDGIVKYVPVYFKDSEYFGNSSAPSYYNNWLQLAEVLDQIRNSFGSPILIKKGFKLDQAKFNEARSVIISPQNNEYSYLMEVIQILVNQKIIEVAKCDLLSNKQIYIEI